MWRTRRRAAAMPWRAGRWLALLVLALLVLVAWHDTFGRPVIRRDTVVLAGLPAGTPPVRLVFISDIHVAGPDMTPQRLGGIVRTINALHPDAVLIAGDFISNKPFATAWYSDEDVVRPLAGLRSRWGTYAVLGNHDYDRGGMPARHWLKHYGVNVLVNWASRVGPITLVGYDDAVTTHARPLATNAAMQALPPPYVAMSHSPEILPFVPRDVHLLLAGHTHCGQIVVPFWGPVVGATTAGWRYVCGRVEDPGRTTFITAGLGTSGLPIRFGVRPEIRVITLVPPGAAMPG